MAWTRSCWRARRPPARYPARAVQTLDAIIRDAESSLDRRTSLTSRPRGAIQRRSRAGALRGRRHAGRARRRAGDRRGHPRRQHGAPPVGAAAARADSRDHRSRRHGPAARALLGRLAGLHRHRRERRLGRHADRRSSWSRAASCRPARRRARQHQPRPDAQRRELPEDPATLMSGVPLRDRSPRSSLAFAVAAVAVRVAAAPSSIGCSAALDIVGCRESRRRPRARAAAHPRARRSSPTASPRSPASRWRSSRFGHQRAEVGSAPARPAGSLTHGINIVIILAGAFIVVRAANLAIEHLQFKLARRHARHRSRVAAARGDARRHPHEPGHGRRSASSRC